MAKLQCITEINSNAQFYSDRISLDVYHISASDQKTATVLVASLDQPLNKPALIAAAGISWVRKCRLELGVMESLPTELWKMKNNRS